MTTQARAPPNPSSRGKGTPQLVPEPLDPIRESSGENGSSHQGSSQGSQGNPQSPAEERRFQAIEGFLMSTSKEEGTEQAEMGNWSLLPSDLVQTIAERLLADVTDYIRFRAVCFSWRASTEDPRRILVPPQLPMLMLSFNEVATNARSFFRLGDQRTITFELEREIANNRFVGSVDGWLALVNESSAMHLFDPLTGDLVRLPSMSTLLNILEYDEDKVGEEYIVLRDGEFEDVDAEFLRDIFVLKVALSSVHHERNPIAMVLLQFFDKLVFARVGDDIWTEIDTTFHYCDILYYQGQFYAVGDYGELIVCDLVGAKATQKTSEVDITEMGITFCHWYLAECAGDLLVIARNYKETNLHHHVYELEKFLVFKVENLSDEPKLVLMESLGDHVLFLGSNQSISLSASDFPGTIKGNSIYFTGSCFDVCPDSAQAPKPGNKRPIREFFHKGDDFGVFNLADGNVKSLPCYPGNFHQFIWPPPVWFGLNIRQESDCLRKFFLPKGAKPCMKNSTEKSGLNEIKAFLKERLNGKPAGGSSQETKTSASIELTPRNFDELILKSKELWIVEFFTPWCVHCKNLAPEWKSASNNLKGKVKLGHVDCDTEKSLMSRYSVQVFPTILVFGAYKDSPFQYEGAKTASAIESFALEQLETNVAPPEVSELTGPDVMEEKCAPAAICFVAFLPDILDSKAEGRNKYIELLLSVAEKFKRSPYSYVWAAAGKQVNLENQVGIGGYGYPALIALNVKKGVYAPLRSAFELDQVIEFVKEAGRGGQGNLPLGNAPTVALTEPWDGKDGEIIEDDEFLLEDLMGDEAATDNDEL